MKNINNSYFSLRRMRGGNPQALIDLLNDSTCNTTFIDDFCYEEKTENWNLKHLFWMTKGIYGVYDANILIGVAYVYVQNNRHYLGINIKKGYQNKVNLHSVEDSVKQLCLYCHQIDDIQMPSQAIAEVSEKAYYNSYVA